MPLWLLFLFFFWNRGQLQRPSCQVAVLVSGLSVSVLTVVAMLVLCAGVGEGLGVLGCSSRGWPQVGDQCSGPTHQGMDFGTEATACLPFIIFCLLRVPIATYSKSMLIPIVRP